MKKTKKENFLKWNSNILINSIKKIDLNIILIIILDALFYLSSGFLAIFWLQRIQVKIAGFNLPTDVAILGAERAQQLVSEVKAFYYLILISFILLLIAIIFLASILKGIIWAKSTNTKITFELISKFLLLNLIWMGFWFVLIILVSLFVEPASAPLFIIITIIIGVYFTNAIYTLFMKKQEYKSVISAVKLSVAKIHLFLLPYAVISLLLYVLLKLSNLLKFKYSAIFLGLILLIYAAVVRYYFSALVLKVVESN